MILKITELGRGERRYEFAVTPESLRIALGMRTDVVGEPSALARVAASLYGRNVNVAGEIRLRFAAECGRCAGEFDAEMVIPWKMVLAPHREGSGPEDEDIGFGYYRYERVDLGRVVAEHAALMLPDVLLCDERCLGLCAVCGANLNEGSCRCETRTD